MNKLLNHYPLPRKIKEGMIVQVNKGFCDDNQLYVHYLDSELIFKERWLDSDTKYILRVKTIKQ
jgi:hypothetical protein